MKHCSSPVAEPAPAAGSIERRLASLGTLVAIRIEGLDAAQAHEAIDRGFAAIANVHALMSFHDAASDVSRLNRLAWREPVAVAPETRAVLAHAIAMARASRGAFDIAVGGEMVARGLLPEPVGAPVPHPAASWRDMAIGEDGMVRFARPLWIDLGGIAKGHAVDAAIAAIAAPGDVQVVVNAGGDLRVRGPCAEAVRLDMDLADVLPVIRIENAALASSTGAVEWGAARGGHIDGRDRRTSGEGRFASVVASDCMTADALTKAVLAMGAEAEPVLREYDAAAYLYDRQGGWSTLGAE